MAVEILELGAVAVVRTGDELVLLGYQELAEKLEGLIHEGARRIVLDLGAATYVNSSTVRALVAVCEKNAGVGVSIALARPGQGPMTLIEAMGVSDLLPVFGSVDEGLASFDRR
jgi:anti-anti-sigma factor